MLRGSQQTQAQIPGVHLLAAYRETAGCVVHQTRVDDRTNEAKAALELLAHLVLEKAVITGDAIFCQKELCAKIVARKGDYLFVVKENQPALKEALVAAFSEPISPLRTQLVARPTA
jgi:hypothetical protein